METKNVLLMAAVIWLAIQVSGVFNNLMQFNTSQGLFGSAVAAGVIAASALYVQKVSMKRGDG